MTFPHSPLTLCVIAWWSTHVSSYLSDIRCEQPSDRVCQRYNVTNDTIYVLYTLADMQWHRLWFSFVRIKDTIIRYRPFVPWISKQRPANALRLYVSVACCVPELSRNICDTKTWHGCAQWHQCIRETFKIATASVIIGSHSKLRL